MAYLDLDEPRDFDSAAGIYRELRRRGTTISSPFDCLIAAIAIRSRSALLHRDRDFTAIARASGLAVI